AIVDEFILADGVAHPAEEKLRDDLKRLLAEPVEITEFEVVDDESEKHVQLAGEQAFVPRADDHPFFARMEQPYPRDQMGFAQYAMNDVELVKKVRNTLAEQRKLGAGRLKGVQSFTDLAGQAPFLDGHVYVLPPDPSTAYELIVLRSEERRVGKERRSRWSRHHTKQHDINSTE